MRVLFRESLISDELREQRNLIVEFCESKRMRPILWHPGIMKIGKHPAASYPSLQAHYVRSRNLPPIYYERNTIRGNPAPIGRQPCRSACRRALPSTPPVCKAQEGERSSATDVNFYIKAPLMQSLTACRKSQ